MYQFRHPSSAKVPGWEHRETLATTHRGFPSIQSPGAPLRATPHASDHKHTRPTTRYRVVPPHCLEYP